MARTPSIFTEDVLCPVCGMGLPRVVFRYTGLAHNVAGKISWTRNIRPGLQNREARLGHHANHLAPGIGD